MTTLIADLQALVEKYGDMQKEFVIRPENDSWESGWLTCLEQRTDELSALLSREREVNIHRLMIEENNHISEMSDMAIDAERWRYVSNLAWFVDAAARVFDIAGKPWEPKPYDEDDIIAIIDAALTTAHKERT